MSELAMLSAISSKIPFNSTRRGLANEELFDANGKAEADAFFRAAGSKLALIVNAYDVSIPFACAPRRIRSRLRRFKFLRRRKLIGFFRDHFLFAQAFLTFLFAREEDFVAIALVVRSKDIILLFVKEEP